jgi:hypothetical protein
MLVSLTSFSQTATALKTDSVVILDKPIAKFVIKDLIAYDGLKLELKTTQDLLLNTESKVSTQAAIIKQFEIKSGQYDKIISNYKTQVEAYKGMTEDLKKDLRKSKIKGFYNKFGLSIIIGGLTYLYITK